MQSSVAFKDHHSDAHAYSEFCFFHNSILNAGQNGKYISAFGRNVEDSISTESYHLSCSLKNKLVNSWGFNMEQKIIK